MPKQSQCSNCYKLGHNKSNSVCEKYFEKILLEPTNLMEDGSIKLTKAVISIRKFIDKRPGILKVCVDDEAMFGFKDGGWFGFKDGGWLPLHWVCKKKCPLQVVQLVYEKYPEAIKIERDHDGYLPLHCAFNIHPKIQRQDVIRFLISKNSDARTYCPLYGQIPLHYFCGAGIVDGSEEAILDALLSNCPETLWTERSGDNRNALEMSSSENLSSMLRKKIVHYAREFKSTNSHDCFFHLFRSNCSDKPTLQFYCEEWPEFACFDLGRGARPLHIACSAAVQGFCYRMCLDESIRYLVTRAPDVLALQDSSGCTPLHLLLRNNNFGHSDARAIDLISFILKADPKVLSVRDNEGFTPLLVASQSNLSLAIIHSMLRFDPQLNISSSWFSDRLMCGPIQRKRKR
jgi:ankyrin repeat protein